MIHFNLNPIIISFGALEIRWYSLAYIVGILFSSWYTKRADKYKILNSNQHESLLFWSILGIILGGRIGYIVFYNFTFYIQYPSEMFKIWNGGMSFHGGIVGLIISIVVICRIYGIGVLYILDLVACSAPLGIFLGRIANFINGELYGKVTEAPWGVIFPTSNDFLPRHPSQLYESFFEGLLLFLFLNYLLLYTCALKLRGVLSGLFLIWYSVSRFTIEFLREPDSQIGYIIFDTFTMGQILSLPTMLIGIYLLTNGMRNTKQTIHFNL